MTKMLHRQFAWGAAIGGMAWIWSCAAGLAQESNASLHQQIDLLKGEMTQMQQKLERLQQQEQRNEERANAAAQAAQQAEAHTLPPNAPRVTESATHRFGLTSADGQNAIELTGRLHLDAADYLNTRSDLASARGDNLNGGINARRARIGFDGRFMGDWAYALIYDFGNTSDTVNINNFAAQNTRLQPAFVDDVAEAIVRIVRRPDTRGTTFECGGPHVYSYDELIRIVAREADLTPTLCPVPFAVWHVLAGIAEILPGPPLTRNQVELMQIDNVASVGMPGFGQLEILPRSFDDIVRKILRPV